jgi:hypothetical protein
MVIERKPSVLDYAVTQPLFGRLVCQVDVVVIGKDALHGHVKDITQATGLSMKHYWSKAQSAVRRLENLGFFTDKGYLVPGNFMNGLVLPNAEKHTVVIPLERFDHVDKEARLSEQVIKNFFQNPAIYPEVLASAVYSRHEANLTSLLFSDSPGALRKRIKPEVGKLWECFFATQTQLDPQQVLFQEIRNRGDSKLSGAPNPQLRSVYLRAAGREFGLPKCAVLNNRSKTVVVDVL